MEPWHTPTKLPLERKPARAVGAGCAILTFATPFSLVGTVFFGVGVTSGPVLFAVIGGIFAIVGFIAIYGAITQFRGHAWFLIDQKLVRARHGVLSFSSTSSLRMFSGVDVVDAEDDEGESYYSIELVHPSADEPNVELAANRDIEVAFELARDYAGLLLIPGPDVITSKAVVEAAPPKTEAAPQPSEGLEASVDGDPAPAESAALAEAVVPGESVSAEDAPWSDESWLELVSAETPDPELLADASVDRISREAGFDALRTRRGLRIDARPRLSPKLAVGVLIVASLFGALDAFGALVDGLFGWSHVLDMLFPFLLLLAISMFAAHGFDQVLTIRPDAVVIRTRVLGFTLDARQFNPTRVLTFRTAKRLKFFKTIEVQDHTGARQFGWSKTQLSAETIALCARVCVRSRSLHIADGSDAS